MRARRCHWTYIWRTSRLSLPPSDGMVNSVIVLSKIPCAKITWSFKRHLWNDSLIVSCVVWVATWPLEHLMYHFAADRVGSLLVLLIVSAEVWSGDSPIVWHFSPVREEQFSERRCNRANKAHHHKKTGAARSSQFASASWRGRRWWRVRPAEPNGSERGHWGKRWSGRWTVTSV